MKCKGTVLSHLGWSTSMNNISSSVFRKLHLIHWKLKHTTPTVKLQGHNTLVRTNLEYASIVSDPPIKKDVKIFESVQRRAIRFIYGKFERTGSSFLMQANNIMEVDQC